MVETPSDAARANERLSPRGELAGKVALITGASRGIGLAMARRFVAAGASVMLTSRNPEAVAEAARSISGDVAAFPAHAGDPDAATACVEATVQRFGALDILVNNAATNPYWGPLIDADLPRFDKTIQVNTRAPLIWSQCAWHAGMQERGGTILNVASVAALRPEAELGLYGISKAALIHLTKVLAAELAPKVRVNCLAPGTIRTRFSRVIWRNFGDTLAASTPLGRLGEADDVARAALFLVSESASWITGEVLVVDGGALVSSGGAGARLSADRP